MNGLIVKDMQIFFKKLSAVNLIIILIGTGFCFFYLHLEGMILVGTLLPALFVSLSKTLFVDDRQSKWDKYAISMPVSKNTIVLSRYISITFIALIGALFAFCLNLILMNFYQDFSLFDLIKTFFIGAGIGIIYSFFLLPFNYSAGTNGGIFAFLTVFILGLLLCYITKNQFSDTLPVLLEIVADNWKIILPICLIVFGILSFMVSKFFYCKKHQ